MNTAIVVERRGPAGPDTHQPFLRGGVLIAAAHAAATLGVEWKPIREALGVAPEVMVDPQAKVNADVVAEALNILAARTGRSDFGLLVGEAMRPGLWANIVPQLNFAVRAQPTLGKAIRFYARNVAIQNNASWQKVEEVGQYLIWKRGFKPRSLANNAYIHDADLAVTAGFIQDLVGSGWRPYMACFARPKPANDSPYRRIFETVEFDHDFDGLVIDQSDSYRPLSGGSPEAIESIERFFAARMDGSTSSLEDFENLTIQMLVEGDCSLQRLADEQGVDRRTIHRRLQAQGLTFSQLVERARKELIESYIGRDDKSLSDLVGLLDFSGMSTFSRWFRQTYGMTASDYRKRRLGSTVADRQAVLLARTNEIVLGLSFAGAVLYANPAVGRLGREPLDLVGENLRTLLHPQDRHLISDIELAWSGDFAPRGRPPGQCRLAATSGAYVWFEYAMNPIFDRDGRLAEVLLSLNPLGERKRHEDQAVLFSTALTASRAAVFLVDASGQIEEAFGDTLAAVGRTAADLPGLSIPDLIEEGDQARFQGLLDDAASVQRPLGQSSLSLITRRARDDGTIELSLGWLDMPSGRSSLVVVARPATGVNASG